MGLGNLAGLDELVAAHVAAILQLADGYPALQARVVPHVGREHTRNIPDALLHGHGDIAQAWVNLCPAAPLRRARLVGIVVKQPHRLVVGVHAGPFRCHALGLLRGGPICPTRRQGPLADLAGQRIVQDAAGVKQLLDCPIMHGLVFDHSEVGVQGHHGQPVVENGWLWLTDPAVDIELTGVQTLHLARAPGHFGYASFFQLILDALEILIDHVHLLVGHFDQLAVFILQVQEFPHIDQIMAAHGEAWFTAALYIKAAFGAIRVFVLVLCLGKAGHHPAHLGIGSVRFIVWTEPHAIHKV